MSRLIPVVIDVSSVPSPTQGKYKMLSVSQAAAGPLQTHRKKATHQSGHTPLRMVPSAAACGPAGGSAAHMTPSSLPRRSLLAAGTFVLSASWSAQVWFLPHM